jgi:hypothetical protein
MVRNGRRAPGILILLALVAGVVAVVGPGFLFGLAWLWADTHLPASPPSECQDLAPTVVTRIEASLTIPGGGSLHEAQYVTIPDGWLIATDVQGVEGALGIGVWLLGGTGTIGTDAGAAPLYAVNQLATQISTAPFKAEPAASKELAMRCVSVARQNG